MAHDQFRAIARLPAAGKRVADLRGKTLAVPTSAAFTHMLALELLRRHGLEPGRDVTLRELDHNQNSMAAPLRGDADAAVTGILLWTKEGPHDKMRVLAETRAVPGFLLMAHPRVPKATVARLSKITREFADTPSGKAYFAATGHGAWLPVDDATMRSLDPFMPRFND